MLGVLNVSPIANILLIITVFFSPVTLACHFSVRVNASAPPYYYKNENNEWVGLLIDFANLLGKEASCQPHFQELPWARAIASIKAGQIDMMMNLSKSSEREKFIDFIGWHHQEEMVFITHQQANFKLKHYSDVKNLKGGFGLADKVFYGDDFMNLLETDEKFKSRFVFASEAKKHANVTQMKRLNGFIQDRRSAAYEIKTNPDFKDLKIYPNSAKPLIVHSNPVFFGMSRKSSSPDIKDKIRLAYRKLYLDGEFVRILKSYE